MRVPPTWAWDPSFAMQYGAHLATGRTTHCFPSPPAPRFGAEGGEEAASGGGGGGGGAAVGEIVGGIGQAVGAVTNAALRGEQPDIVAKEQTLRFTGALAALDQLEAELERTRVRHRAAVDWLRNPINHRKWMTGPAAMAVAPKGKKLCPPLYPWVPPLPPQPQRPNPGGHAEGLPHVICPTEDDAFTNAAKKVLPAKKIEARETELLIYKIRHTRPPLGSYKDGIAAETGNIKGARREAGQAWNLLMSLDALAPLFSQSAGAATFMASWRPQGLTARKTLLRLFPDDVDAGAGRVPADVSEQSLRTALAQYALGRIPGNYPLPLWVYGFSQDEARDIPLGPTVAQVATVQAGGPAFSGGYGFDGYGAASTATLRDRLKNLIVTGQIRNVPPSPPSAVPADLVQREEAGRKAAAGWSTGKKVALGVGVAAAAGTGLFLALRR